MNLAEGSINVFGGTGFIGKHLVKELRRLKYHVSSSGGHGYNLVDTPIRSWRFRADYIFNLTGYNGGIQFNQSNQIEIFYQNTLMNLRLINIAAKVNCKKILSTIASCAYPPNINIIPEKSGLLYEGSPHPSVSSHAFAKRNVAIMSELVAKHTNTQSICVCPTTVFGPNDSLDENKSKVVGSLIIKFLKAKKENAPFVQLMGDGTPLRQFIYVKDLVKLLILAMEQYNDCSIPLHLASDTELTISELAEEIKKIVGYYGTILWTDASDNGQMRKKLTTQLSQGLWPAFQYTSFQEALTKTVKWYKEHL